MKLKFPFLIKNPRKPGRIGWYPPEVLKYQDLEGKEREVVHQYRTNVKGMSSLTLVPGYLIEKKKDFWVVEPIENGGDICELEEKLGKETEGLKFWNPGNLPFKEKSEYIIEE